MKTLEAHAISFAEWVCRSYMRLNDYWVPLSIYAHQRSEDNQKTTKELYDLWVNDDEYLDRKEEKNDNRL